MTEKVKLFVGEPLQLETAKVLKLIPWNSNRIHHEDVRREFHLQFLGSINLLESDHKLTKHIKWLCEYGLIHPYEYEFYRTTRKGFEILSIIDQIESYGKQLEPIVKAFLINKEDYSYNWDYVKETTRASS